MMKHILQSIAFALILFAAPSALARLNVLFIAVDDLRPELNCYGASHIVSPNIDRLAETGRLFRRHYVSVPTCGASRYSLLTGKHPASIADTRNTAFHQLPKSERASPESFAHLFRRDGWHTVSLGKVSHEPDGFIWKNSAKLGGDDRGRLSVAGPEMPFSWDEIVFGHGQWGARANPLFNYAEGKHRVAGESPAYEIGTGLKDDDYLDGQIAKAAITRLEEFKQDNTPFMMAVGFFRPHLPFNAPAAYYSLYLTDDLPAPVPSTAPTGAIAGVVSQSGELGNYGHGYYPGDPVSHRDEGYRRKLRAAYFASVSYVDAQIGRVLDALDRLNLAEETIVVLWGDHGWCLDDYGLLGKHVVLERGLHAPLIIRVPGMNFPGRATDAIVETVDIYPTLAKLCGLNVPTEVNGTSLIPILNNPETRGKGRAYSRQINSMNQDSLRTDRWRLVRVENDHDLYDLQSLPYEVSDVAEANPDVVNELASDKPSVPSTDVPTQEVRTEKTFRVPADKPAVEETLELAPK